MIRVSTLAIVFEVTDSKSVQNAIWRNFALDTAFQMLYARVRLRIPLHTGN